MRQILKSMLHLMYSMGIPFILNRGELPFILNALGLRGEGVEIGVKDGHFSEYILRHWKGCRLYSVDAWREFPHVEYVDEANVTQAEQDRIYRNTCARLSPFTERSKIIRTLSAEAAALFDDNQLDFVYIDAAHDYASVSRDLKAWAPKVHRGGVIAGHDYLEGIYHGTEFGVKRAVNEFAKENGYKVRLSLREPDYKSWFIFVC